MLSYMCRNNASYTSVNFWYITEKLLCFMIHLKVLASCLVWNMFIASRNNILLTCWVLSLCGDVFQV